ncbi:MAG: AzlD domain-containing protein [Pseudomonadota bacterium]
MTFTSLDTWWWPYVFILIAGWVATDMWRWLGVLLGNKIEETSEILVYVRAVATALVAAVIAQLILFPSGALADSSIVLRILAVLTGSIAYIMLGNRIWAGIAVALGVLIWGL